MIEIAPHSPKRVVFKDDDLVCYCFEYTRSDIENDYLENGRSTILGKITAAQKAGGCHCAEK
ncbi:MAG: BFD-like (2Fe-2S) protein [Syntrophobacterales bacterium CG03_land_8_20_14_0_80_58_14]|nr:MAG: BFD-like (2Fe-2S) protein [Syntrophobacterales bacterium CG03_land_8_20_14_0_80_58_14]